MRTLYVKCYNMTVVAPTCSKCGSNEYTVVREDADSWTYHCEHCDRDISYDELMGFRGEA